MRLAFVIQKERGVRGKSAEGFPAIGISPQPPFLPKAAAESRKKKRHPDRVSFLERLRGVEPPYAAWEAAVLPMNYSRVWMV